SIITDLFLIRQIKSPSGTSRQIGHKKIRSVSLLHIMKVLLLSMLSVIGQTSGAQVNIICPGLTDSSLNYLYIGIDNPVEVVGKKIPAGYTLSISSGAGSLQKVNPNKYILRTNVATDELVITMHQNKKVLFQKAFRTRMIAMPLACFPGGFRDTTISRSRLVANPFLILYFPDCYFRFIGRINSFRVFFTSTGDSISLTSTSNYFDNEQLRIIKELPSGSIIYFKDIWGDTGASHLVKLSPFWIKLE
ncbi:MAG: hypothetical protein ABL876_16935, partial [Chitinophagaceae bacterium]